MHLHGVPDKSLLLNHCIYSWMVVENRDVFFVVVLFHNVRRCLFVTTARSIMTKDRRGNRMSNRRLPITLTIKLNKKKIIPTHFLRHTHSLYILSDIWDVVSIRLRFIYTHLSSSVRKVNEQSIIYRIVFPAAAAATAPPPPARQHTANSARNSASKHRKSDTYRWQSNK